MNSHFNRQFILIDFRLLEDRRFMKFVGSNEFATYLVLLRHTWRRSSQANFMGLDRLYTQKRQLACSLTREKIAQATGIALDNISRHLSLLVRKKLVRRVFTGRQSIYVLGEWVDVKGDGTHKMEWFYLEGEFGVSKADLTQDVRADLTSSSDQPLRQPSDINRQKHKEGKTVNGVFQQLPDLEQPKAKTEYVAQTILDTLGDEHSQRFYNLVAAKVPEDAIRRALAEIKADGAEHPARLFTYKMKQVAIKRHKAQIGRDG